MTIESDRRTRIAEAVIRIAADEGIRAVTHRAVDRDLGLPPGSTSFYARTRRDLLAAAATELATRARGVFADSGMREPTSGPPDLADVAAGIAGFLEHMLTEHRQDIVARYALTLELRHDPELHALLAAATFSQPLAEQLMNTLGAANASESAANLISLAEGLLFDRTIGQRAVSRQHEVEGTIRPSLQEAIHHYLRGSLASRPPGAALGIDTA